MERKKSPRTNLSRPCKIHWEGFSNICGSLCLYPPPKLPARYVHLPYLWPASAVTQVAEQQQAGLTQRQLQLAPGWAESVLAKISPVLMHIGQGVTARGAGRWAIQDTCLGISTVQRSQGNRAVFWGVFGVWLFSNTHSGGFCKRQQIPLWMGRLYDYICIYIVLNFSAFLLLAALLIKPASCLTKYTKQWQRISRHKRTPPIISLLQHSK